MNQENKPEIVEIIVRKWAIKDKYACTKCGKKLVYPKYECDKCQIKIKPIMQF